MSITHNPMSLDLNTFREPRSVAATCEILSLVEQGFGTEFTILDGMTGDTLTLAERQPACDWGVRSEMCREVARHRQPEFIEEEGPLLALALPFHQTYDVAFVAVGLFVTRSVGAGEDLSSVARRMGMRNDELVSWASIQTPWNSESLLRAANLAMAQWASRQRIRELESETQSLSDHLSTTYEEIGLLHRLIHNLKISKSDEELGRVALGWLSEVMAVESLAIQYLPTADTGTSSVASPRTSPVLVTMGHSLLAPEEYTRLVRRFDNHVSHQPLVFNPPATQTDDWPFPQVRQLIAVPLAEGDNLFGWLMGVNHVRNKPFGSVEASLLGSVGAILGIHGGNIELYRQQSGLLAGVVRALTSAIDAKDPYTCGHSDRVASLAVRLAQEMGCDERLRNTIYLAGLLHDVGKIGINDAVLRKPGKLSDSEYEHIKQHVRIGHRILVDIKKLDDVLPIVLHHHESWDGQGYPDRLTSDQIPFSARILSVADAYDAMASDRPYRRGLPDEKIDEVFRAGAGKQWDPEVVAAFFQAREDLRHLVRGNLQSVEVRFPMA
jgi:putative nucleotidyltransferase with HDIG domain